MKKCSLFFLFFSILFTSLPMHAVIPAIMAERVRKGWSGIVQSVAQTYPFSSVAEGVGQSKAAIGEYAADLKRQLDEADELSSDDEAIESDSEEEAPVAQPIQSDLSPEDQQKELEYMVETTPGLHDWLERKKIADKVCPTLHKKREDDARKPDMVEWLRSKGNAGQFGYSDEDHVPLPPVQTHYLRNSLFALGGLAALAVMYELINWLNTTPALRDMQIVDDMMILADKDSLTVDTFEDHVKKLTLVPEDEINKMRELVQKQGDIEDAIVYMEETVLAHLQSKHNAQGYGSRLQYGARTRMSQMQLFGRTMLTKAKNLIERTKGIFGKKKETSVESD